MQKHVVKLVYMKKLDRLRSILKHLSRVVIAYSGGLDSTFLLKAAVDALGKDNVIAVTARSATYPASEYREAKRLARRMGARLITIRTDELEMKDFRRNPVNRCYYCKKELFSKLDAIRRKFNMSFVCDGTNVDDLKDIRFGKKAAKELGVRSPLLEAGIAKADIRRFSKRLGLPTHDKPSFACLASRIPFNSDITSKDLARIEGGEEVLRRLGFRQVRLRLHGDIARLEFAKKDLTKAVKLKDAITAKLKRLGFTYVTLDLEGYRTGSMHEAVACR